MAVKVSGTTVISSGRDLENIDNASVTSLTLGGTNVTSTAAELNLLDGVTASTAELNILDGVTVTTSDINGVVNKVPQTSATGAAVMPSGTETQRPTPATGQLRFNTDASSFEGYNGSEWGSIGGGATSDAIYENSATIAEDITIVTGRNGMSTGPITINSGITVTVESGARYVVI